MEILEQKKEYKLRSVAWKEENFFFSWNYKLSSITMKFSEGDKATL